MKLDFKFDWEVLLEFETEWIYSLRYDSKNKA